MRYDSGRFSISKILRFDFGNALRSRLLLSDFLYPAINWQPKGDNIQWIANNLNIHVDTFAFIDDMPFERAQVESQVKGVRCYDPAEIDGLLALPEFDVPVTWSHTPPSR